MSLLSIVVVVIYSSIVIIYTYIFLSLFIYFSSFYVVFFPQGVYMYKRRLRQRQTASGAERQAGGGFRRSTRQHVQTVGYYTEMNGGGYWSFGILFHRLVKHKQEMER